MAYIETKLCHKCEKPMTHVNGNCSRCSELAESMRVAVWNAMTTDEKLADLRRRMEQLEKRPATY